ncbi:hypothetical protein FG386_001826 [Cryptosporidium ryanae]|uniref:uncharacterized protein n=1 Tax=Cryptosporidium ryanae TaxID=515981 RepID=UPI00351A3406|nr:hypothetical protein FG386_001826 [Cryptosporidium ryanae]
MEERGKKSVLSSKNGENSALNEKRLGLYVLMGSVVYILTIKNRAEKGWLEQPYSWILILFRAGPLGGMILMIPNMISSLKIQIQSFCETIMIYHLNSRVSDISTMVRDLFPNLDKQFIFIEYLRKYFVKGLFFLCIGESISEVSVNYSESTDMLSLSLPFISSVLRSIGFSMFCIGILMDFQKTRKRALAFTATISCCFAACFYIATRLIYNNLILSSTIIYTQTVMGKIQNTKLFSLFISFELTLATMLFVSSVLRKFFNVYASSPSKTSPIVGSLLILNSVILRSFHTKSTGLPYYIPYLEIGPLIWGSFILIHSIPLYVRYESQKYQPERISNTVPNCKKSV